jgi:hypothetical protein
VRREVVQHDVDVEVFGDVQVDQFEERAKPTLNLAAEYVAVLEEVYLVIYTSTSWP